MDFIIVFFRDVLDGPLYIAIVVINSILICSCIGYLGEQYLNRKKSQAKFNNTYAAVSNNTNAVGVSSVPQVSNQVSEQGNTTNNQVQ